MKYLRELVFASTYVILSFAALAQSDSRQEWVALYNSGSTSISQLYYSSPILISPELEVFETTEGVKEFYNSLRASFSSLGDARSLGTVEAHPNFTYEIIETAAGEVQLKQLVIWRKWESSLLRELEVVGLGEKGLLVDPGIDLARAKWEELCNAHQPAELVSQLYTIDALYYNHKPLVKGREAITSEYGYMSNPAYKLKLAPLFVEMVSQTMAFELGKCSGSYGGNYMLVWVKNKEGNWQVALDANI